MADVINTTMLSSGDAALAGGILALVGAFLVLFLLISLVFYIYTAIALMTIAKKTNTPNGWLGFIPIANFYLMLKIAKLPLWLMFGLLLIFIPFIGSLVLLVLMIYVWWKIAEARNYPGWISLLLLLPIVNLVLIGVIAWRDNDAQPIQKVQETVSDQEQKNQQEQKPLDEEQDQQEEQ